MSELVNSSRNDRIHNFLAKIALSEWLGFGRTLEFFLVCITVSYGLALLLVPGAALKSLATYELAYLGYSGYIAIPFLMKAVFTGYGLIANIFDLRFCRTTRFIGALVGSFIWSSYIIQFFLVDSFFTLGSWFCFYAFFASIRIMVMALADLPPPRSRSVP
jgi:hypothetical protein